jgi:hypothetical protein
VIFLDLVLEPGVLVPSELRYRFSFSVVRDDGTPIEKTVNGPVVALIQELPLLLHAPPCGTWIAFNALAAYDHRRALNPFDGRIRNAQRLAIDWMRLGPDGCLFHAGNKSNANFYGYGADVLAVADARVSDLKVDLPDNVGVNDRKSRIITLDNAVGNYVTLDVGHGRFALYAHLQPGSLERQARRQREGRPDTGPGRELGQLRRASPPLSVDRRQLALGLGGDLLRIRDLHPTRRSMVQVC